MDESYSHLETLVTVPGGNQYYSQSVGELFKDFKARRASLIRALTTGLLTFPLLFFVSFHSLVDIIINDNQTLYMIFLLFCRYL